MVFEGITLEDDKKIVEHWASGFRVIMVRIIRIFIITIGIGIVKIVMVMIIITVEIIESGNFIFATALGYEFSLGSLPPLL